MNYYNEWDKPTAAWLQELINERLIPDGHVDTRSICDVQPGDLDGYTQCHFFAGIGGWPLALHLAGWPTDRPVWTGSCPCQPFSSAGKQKGTADERHLWPAFFALIRQCRPEHVFGEQVAGAIGHGWLDGVSADLESEGYACGAVVLGAHSVSAPHIRQRLYWLADSQRRPAERHGYELAGAACGVQGEARQRQRLRDDAGHGGTDSWLVHPNGTGPQQGQQATEAARYGSAAESAGSRLGDADFQGLQGRPAVRERGDERTPWSSGVAIPCADGKSRRVEPSIQLLAHGVPARVVRLRGYGNAIVPQCAQAFIEAYMETPHA